MASGTPLSEAFVRIRPEGDDFGRDLTKEIGKASGDAAKAGADIGRQVVDGTSPVLKELAKLVSEAMAKAGPAATPAAKKTGKAVGDAVAKGTEDGAKAIPKAVEDAAKKAGGNERAFLRIGGSIGEHIKLGVGQQLGGLRGVVAGAIAGLGVEQLFEKGLEQTGTQANFAARLGLDPAQSAKAGEIAGRLFANNFGDSLETAQDAVARVAQDLQIGLNDVNLEPITGKILNLSQTMGQDLGAVTRGVGQLMRTGLVPDANAAIDVITAGFQHGGDRAEDLLDTINEYSTQFRDLGLTGGQSLGILIQGLNAGARDSDVVADSLKELNIRVKDLSGAPALKALGLNADQMAEAFARGGPKAAAALNTILGRLRAVKDPADRFRLAQQLLGTQSEDLSKALLALDPSKAVGALGQVSGAADKMGDTLSGSPAAKVETFKRQISQRFNEVAATVVTTVFDMGPKVKAGFGGVISAIRTGSADAGGALGAVEGFAAGASNTIATLFGQDIAGEAQNGLTKFAGTVHDTFAPTVQAVGDVVDAVVPKAVDLFHTVVDGAHPFIVLATVVGGLLLAGGKLAVTVGSVLLPLLIRFAGPVLGALITVLGAVYKALSAALGFVEDHAKAFGIAAGIITSLFLPAMIAAGVQATIAGVKIVAAWVKQGAAAVTGAARSVAAWVAVQASAVRAQLATSAAVVRMVAGWVASAAAATAGAVRTVAGWVVTAAAATASGIASAVAFAAYIGGWILLGAQSLLAAARVAAAWLIAIGPIALVVAAIAGTVLLVIKYWDQIRAATVAVWHAVTGAVTAAVGAVVEFVKAHWPLLLAIITGPIGLAVLALVKSWGAITGAAKAAWSAVTGVVRSGVGSVVGVITGLPGKIASVGGSMLTAGKNLLSKVFDGMKSIAGGAGSFAASIGKSIANKLIDGLNSILPHHFPRINTHIPGIGTIGGWQMFPNLPHLARGGRARPGVAIVGEEGPELVRFGEPGTVTPAGPTDRLLHSGLMQAPPPMAVGPSIDDMEEAFVRALLRVLAGADVRIDQRGYVAFHKVAMARGGG